MSFGQLGVIALVIYLFGLIGVAEFARRARRDLSPSDHFLAGRELGVFVLLLTLYATAYSGNSLLGYPGEAYRRGFSWIMATGFMMSIIVVFHALAPRLRLLSVQHGFVTPGDYIKYRFGGDALAKRLLIAVAILMIAALANFLFAQLKAMGELTELVTDGIVPYEAGVVGLALLILFYETLGGMRAVAWTDAAQGILMLVGLVSMLVWLLGATGGLEQVTLTIASLRPEAVRVPDATECANWLSTVLLLGLASVIYPQAIQRIYAARSGTDLKRAFAIMGFMPLTTTFVVTLIGLVAITRFPDLVAAQADTVMPRLLEEWATAGPLASIAAIVVFIGALAAIMSTADSVLLSLGSLIAEDLLGRSRQDPATTKLGKRIAAGVLIAMILLAMNRSISLWRLIELKMELLIQCVPAFMLAMHWKKTRPGPTLLGLLVGTGIAVVCVLAGTKRIYGFHVGVLSLFINITIVWFGSLTPPRVPSLRSGDAAGVQDCSG
ncbi:MAG: sodium:solute symporter family protein [bacterium]|nr:sodium:solute symporter family protein [bacterium]